MGRYVAVSDAGAGVSIIGHAGLVGRSCTAVALWPALTQEIEKCRGEDARLAEHSPAFLHSSYEVILRGPADCSVAAGVARCSFERQARLALLLAASSRRLGLRVERDYLVPAVCELMLKRRNPLLDLKPIDGVDGNHSLLN